MRRQKDFGMDHAAFACVVAVLAVLAVILAVKPFSGSVRSGGYRALSRAAFDLLDAEMIKRDTQSPSSMSLRLFNE